jgi:molecular chaperone HtpG
LLFSDLTTQFKKIMAKIEFPRLLKQLLEESCLQAPVRALADQIGNILSDNKLPFFPDYTDHGIDHVNRVLQFEVELVPKTVWEKSQNNSDPRLLCDADAAVIIGATLLHDIAMHLRENGFRELVSSDSRFKPLPWFNDAHEGHADDLPWHELWEEYVREAKRFSERDLAKIIGEKEARAWKFDQLPDEIGQWVKNHYLIIGEFIRRHHARLAHEIAFYGFPGLLVGSGEHQFPAMGTEKGHHLSRLADLIGLTARSHGMNLRTCKAYLDWKYPGTPRPMCTAVLYPMALLRVADYFQIDRQRAPAVLLQLRNPQSPVSVQEWKKHLAVQHIGPATDPRGKMVTISRDICLSLYLQLQELLKEMQAEMDHSTAVLDEAYGTRSDLGLDQLNLSIRRVYSNMHDTAFRDNLPYVPNPGGFTADPNLLSLLVEPLYGKQPGVGVRELTQNAVDAVCELDAWSRAHGVAIESLDLPDQDGDVLIDFIKRDNDTWFLRVRDRGIGMQCETIQNYFLRAGASFRQSSEWAKEFLGDNGQPNVTRAGRFGIGVFAVFLLGSSFRLWTRHVSANKSMGYKVEASANSLLIEIKRESDLPIGSTIEVEMSNESVEAFRLNEGNFRNACEQSEWFCWDWPKVFIRILYDNGTVFLWENNKSNNINYVPVREINCSPELSVIYPKGFDAVYWTFNSVYGQDSSGGNLSVNGFMVGRLETSDGINYTYNHFEYAYFFWPKKFIFNSPGIAVLDRFANLPLTIQRYKLTQKALSFTNELVRDVIFSFIAHSLVCGPMSCIDAVSSRKKIHPLMRYHSEEGLTVSADLRWCVTSAEMIPADPWLYSLLNVDSCLLWGDISKSNSYYKSKDFNWSSVNELLLTELIRGINSFALLRCHDELYVSEEKEDSASNFYHSSFNFLSSMLISAKEKMLEHEIDTSTVLVSVNQSYSLVRTRTILSKPFRLSELDCNWKKVSNSNNFNRHWFEVKLGTHIPVSCESLNGVLEVLETGIFNNRNLRFNPDVLYVSEIKTRRKLCLPESLVAKLWHECLGARAIPFDPAAREALIADGCNHPELKRHIEAWQEMKRTGSKWVTGE